MTGAALGMAMHLGRVYLPHPVGLIVALQSGATLLTYPTSPLNCVLQDGDNFFFETQIEFCRNAKRNEPGMNCFYAPYSKCTVKDAAASVGELLGHSSSVAIRSVNLIPFAPTRLCM
jgi:hypothetical protein